MGMIRKVTLETSEGTFSGQHTLHSQVHHTVSGHNRHLLVSSVAHKSQRWSISRGSQARDSLHTSLPIAEEEAQVLQRAEVISSASRPWQEKIKCLHSVSTALFQMLPLPLKRPSWAWMANEQFWGLSQAIPFLSPSAAFNPPPHP